MVRSPSTGIPTRATRSRYSKFSGRIGAPSAQASDRQGETISSAFIPVTRWLLIWCNCRGEKFSFESRPASKMPQGVFDVRMTAPYPLYPLRVRVSRQSRAWQGRNRQEPVRRPRTRRASAHPTPPAAAGPAPQHRHRRSRCVPDAARRRAGRRCAAARSTRSGSGSGR